MWNYEVGKLFPVVTCAPDKISITESHDATSKTKLVNSILEDPRGALLDDSDETDIKNHVIECPEIEILLNGVKITALVDTGSPVTCISEEVYKSHVDIFKKSPTLPVVGQIIKGAIGARSIRLKIQFFAEVQMGKTLKNINILVIPKLARDCIIGMDALQVFDVSIKINMGMIELRETQSDSEMIFYKNSNLKSEEANHRKIEAMDMSEMDFEDIDSENEEERESLEGSINSQKFSDKLLDEHESLEGSYLLNYQSSGEADLDDITMQEVDEKLKNCICKNPATLEKLKNLI